MSRHRSLRTMIALALTVLVALSTAVPASAAVVPDAPTGLMATPGDGRATLSWTAPADHGSPITGYVVTVPGAPQNYFSTGTTIAAVNLQNGTTYTFTVHAINSETAGPESAPSAPFTPTGLPGAPTGVTAVIAGSGSITVTWQAPLDTGGLPILGYTVTAVSSGASVTTSGTTLTATVTGLANGVAHTFTVHATNAKGAGPDSAATTEIILGLPGAPSAVTAFAGNASATVSWLAPDPSASPISSFTVSSPSLPAGVVTGGTATSVVVAGLANGTAYTFTVHATNSYGDGPESAPSSEVVPVPTVPGAPTDVMVVPGDASVTVSWVPPLDDGGSPILGYGVTNNEGTAAGLDQPGTSLVFLGLTNGTPYTFTVTAYNENGTGPPSPPSVEVTPNSTVPDAPANVIGVPGNQSATVQWAAPLNQGAGPITSYTVRVTTATASFTRVSVDGSTLSATLTGLTNGTAYFFYVSATNLAGDGPESDPVRVIPNARPGPPTNVAVTAGSRTLTAAWTAPANSGASAIVSYTMTATPVTGPSAPPVTAVTADGTTLTATVTGLSNGTTYAVTVHATNAQGSGPESSPAVRSTPVGLPGTPGNVTAVAGNGSATVSWSAPLGTGGSPILSYTVTSSPGSISRTTADGSTLTTRLTGLTNGTAYTFTVHATNAQGNGPESTASAPVTPAIQPGSPGAPTGVSAAAGNGAATVTWSAPATTGSSAIIRYTVTSSPGGVAVSTANGTTRTATVSGLTNGTAYTFTVSATNTQGSGPESLPSAPVTPLGPPGAPTGVAASPGDGSAVVTWSAPANTGGSAITSYTVTGSPGPVTATTANGSTLAITVAGLTNGTTYTFTVHATSAQGSGAESTPTESVTPIGPPGAPSNVTAVAANHAAAVSWSAPSNDGGSPVQHYTVTASPGGATAATLGPVTTLIMNGLSNGTAYTFKVQAHSALGDGPESGPSAPVTPIGPPGAPTNVTAVASVESAVVSWSPPTDTGGRPITGYTVTLNPDVGDVTTNAATLTVSVFRLTPGVAYTFTVRASNDQGVGPPSEGSNAATPLAGSRYNPISPFRAWDSRFGPGPTGRLGAATVRDVTVTGAGGVPASGVTAVVLNVTAVAASAGTFVTVWPTGEVRPLASNLNVPPGDNRPNLVTVKLGAGGQVSFYNDAGTVDLIADVAGWYGPGGGQGYTGVSPFRVWDSRFGPGPTGRIGTASSRHVTVTGLGGVPATGVSAVVLNVTAVNATALTFVTVWPTGEPRPLASNLNLPSGDTRPNLVVVKVGDAGRVSFYNDTGTIDLIADVAGYFSDVGSSFVSVSPARVWDSRFGPGPMGRIGPAGTRDIAVTGLAGVPTAGVSAVVLNVTAVAASAGTFVTVWPAGEAKPLASNLNIPPGDTRPNLVVVKVGAGGRISFSNDAGNVDLIADIAGWWGG